MLQLLRHIVGALPSGLVLEQRIHGTKNHAVIRHLKSLTFSRNSPLVKASFLMGAMVKHKNMCGACRDVLKCLPCANDKVQFYTE